MATISAAGGKKLVEGVAPLLEGFDLVPFGDHEALKAAVGEATAAVMIEPIQGEGGIRPVPGGCLEGLRELCDERDILLVFDEVQCGMGRTGTLFAHEQWGIAPDIMGIAKGLGGGFPIGACLATARAAAGMTAGSHGSTFGGNPLACAVANAVLDVMLEAGFLDRVAACGRELRERLLAIQARYPEVVAEVRGMGLIAGLRIAQDQAGFIRRLQEHGLLTVPAADQVVRLLPPLTIAADELEQGCAMIEAACRETAATRETAG
jgi:acetylornithine/N-succinyldiaminopimelate aminotransferase